MGQMAEGVEARHFVALLPPSCTQHRGGFLSDAFQNVMGMRERYFNMKLALERFKFACSGFFA